MRVESVLHLRRSKHVPNVHPNTTSTPAVNTLPEHLRATSWAANDRGLSKECGRRVEQNIEREYSTTKKYSRKKKMSKRVYAMLKDKI